AKTKKTRTRGRPWTATWTAPPTPGWLLGTRGVGEGRSGLLIAVRRRARDTLVSQRPQLAVERCELAPDVSKVGSLARTRMYELVGQERREGAVQHDAHGHRHHPHHPPGVCHGVAVAVADRGDGYIGPPQRVG